MEKQRSRSSASTLLMKTYASTSESSPQSSALSAVAYINSSIKVQNLLFPKMSSSKVTHQDSIVLLKVADLIIACGLSFSLADNPCLHQLIMPACNCSTSNVCPNCKAVSTDLLDATFEQYMKESNKRLSCDATILV